MVRALGIKWLIGSNTAVSSMVSSVQAKAMTGRSFSLSLSLIAQHRKEAALFDTKDCLPTPTNELHQLSHAGFKATLAKCLLVRLRGHRLNEKKTTALPPGSQRVALASINFSVLAFATRPRHLSSSRRPSRPET